jgi:hypothetical protein
MLDVNIRAGVASVKVDLIEPVNDHPVRLMGVTPLSSYI